MGADDGGYESGPRGALRIIVALGSLVAGAALWGVAAAIGPELRSIPNTEGSAAGTIMLVVFGSIALGAGLAGLPLVIWGFRHLTPGASTFRRLFVAMLVGTSIGNCRAPALKVSSGNGAS